MNVDNSIRVANLNLSAYPNPPRGQIHRLAELLAEQEPDIILMQECLRPWLQVVCDVTETIGVHAHDDAQRLADFPPDGCAIAVRPPLILDRPRRIPPDAFEMPAVDRVIGDTPPPGCDPIPPRLLHRFSGRSLLADVDYSHARVTVGSFHGTPGRGRVGGSQVGEWKTYFPGAVAVALSHMEQPFLFGIDANEPLAETSDTVTFHWRPGRPGAARTAALLGLAPSHRATDLQRRAVDSGNHRPAGDDHLALTYTTRGGGKRRFDSIWATPEFELMDLRTHYESVLRAGGDHAMLVADLALRA